MVRRPAPKDREVRITAAIIAGLVSLSTDKSGGLLSLPEGRPQIKKDTIQSITRCEWTDRHSYCSVPIERHKPAPRQGRHGLGIADCMILNMRSERRRAERKRTVTASMQSCRKRQTFGKSIGGVQNAECRKQTTPSNRDRARERGVRDSIYSLTNRYPTRLASAHEALPSCSQNRFAKRQGKGFQRCCVCTETAIGAAMDVLLQVTAVYPTREMEVKRPGIQAGIVS